jgi:hypothetical protein
MNCYCVVIPRLGEKAHGIVESEASLERLRSQALSLVVRRLEVGGDVGVVGCGWVWRGGVCGCGCVWVLVWLGGFECGVAGWV